MPYNFDQMLKDGYSVADINQALSQKEGLNYAKMKQDGHSDDDIFQSLKSKYTAPMSDKEATGEFLGALKGAGETVGGVLDAAGQMVVGLPAQIAGGLHGLAKLTSGQGVDAAATAAEETMKNNFGFGSGAISEKGKKYTEKTGEVLSAPGRYAGKVAEAVGLDPIYGELPVNTAMNFLPLHGAAKIPGALLNRAEHAVAARKGGAPEPSIAEKVAALNEKPVEQASPAEDVAFWKQRAEQMQKEAAAKEAPPAVIRAQMEDAGNPYPVAGTPEQMEGLSRSVENLSFENIPPDGVIPRDSMRLPDGGGPMLTVPRGNEWIKDENGMPVRQGTPESSVAPDYINQYMRQDEQARADMGNAIQEANGPKLGQQDTFGTQPLEGFSEGNPSVGVTGPEVPAGVKGSLSLGPNGKQRGAVDFQAIVDLFPKFANSKVQTPVYHGTTKEVKGNFKTNKGFTSYYNDKGGVESNGWISGPKRAYPGDLGVWFSSTPSGTDTFAGARTGVNGGNVHQSYLNLENPKVFETHGEFVDWFQQQTNKGESANKAKRALVKEGHDGIVIKSSLTDGGGERSDFVAFNPEQIKSAISPKGYGSSQRGAIDFGNLFGNKKQAAQSNNLPTEDLKLSDVPKAASTVVRPTTPEHIAEKTSLANKASAINLEGTPYHRVNTMEEALSGIDPKVDKWKYSPNLLRSGVSAVTRSNVLNKPINYARNLLQEGRNAASKLSERYVTGKDGINASYRSLTTDSKVAVMEAMQAFDKNKIEPTMETLKSIGLDDNASSFVLKLREALKARYASANDALMKLGFSPFEDRPGYSPNMFSGAYTSFGGKWVTDGEGKRFVVTHVLQGDTRGQHAAAVEAFKKENPQGTITQRTKRGLNTNVGGNNNTYNGFNDLVAQLAKLDPDFAKAKAIVDQHAADQASSLYRFDVHEIKKAGVKGSLGDRPWLSKEQNAKDWYEGVVNYLETGFRVDSMMGPLAEMSKLITHPDMIEKMPNTVKYLETMKNHIAGNDLNLAGALGNATLNLLTDVFGVGPATARKFIRGGTAVSSASMMGFPNIGFGVMQLTQFFTGGTPEALAVRSALGMDPTHMIKSHYDGVQAIVMMASGHGETVAPHLKEAYQWAKDVGMFAYSEAELSREVFQSDRVKLAKDVINAPTVIGERATRPPLFMIFADVFHKAGFRGEDALLRAQEATQTAMGDYHPDERPIIYSSLGEIGHMVGALTTYKHNFIEQLINKTGNVKKNPGSAAAVAAIALTLYGIGGFPGAEDANKAVQKLTGKSIRELVLTNPDEPNSVLDGVVSAKTGMDFQSRLSQGQMLPDSPLSAAPHVAWWANTFSKAYLAAKNQDAASLKDAAKAITPTGLHGVLENRMFTDESGDLVNSQNQKKYPASFKRTPEEIRYRDILGIKPLREKLYDENTHSMSMRQQVISEKNKDIEKRYVGLVGNNEDLRPIIAEYAKNNGMDEALAAQELLSKLQKIKQEQGMDPRARFGGIPSDSVKSINKYNGYNY